MLGMAALCPLFLADPRMAAVAFVVAAIVPIWATGALAEDYAAILFFTAAIMLAHMPPEVVFWGFQSDSLWLLFAGLVLGAAVRRVGLDQVLAGPLVLIAAGSYRRAILAVSGMCAVLAFAIPSNMTRVLLVIHLASGLADRLGMSAASRGREGLLIMGVLGSYYWGTGILTANVPNMVFAASTADILKEKMGFISYFYQYYPVLSLVKSLLATAIIMACFNETLNIKPASAPSAAPPDTLPQRRGLVAAVLIGCVVLWLTDFWHGISPAWVAMPGALILLLPAARVFPTDNMAQIISFRPFLYAASIFGLGACVAESGLGSAVMMRLTDFFGIADYGPHGGMGLVALLATFIGFLGSNAGMTAVLTPLAPDIATASGLPIHAVLGAIVLGYATVLVPFQIPPIVVGFQVAGITAVRAALYTATVGLIASMVSYPLQILWSLR